jgi:hypothetical protein
MLLWIAQKLFKEAKIHHALKQDKKNKLLTGSLLAMIAAASLILMFGGKGEQVDKELFKVNNLDAIDKVTFESVDGVVELKYSGSKWIVDNSYDADDQMVTVLFATLQEVEAKRQVAASRSDSITNRLKAAGIKVSMYSGSNLENVLFVGGY